MNPRITILRHAVTIGMLLTIACVLSNCSTRPLATQYHRATSYALPRDTQTKLAKAILPMEDAHPKQSGFLLLPNGRDAFLMRIAMIEAAERTVDLQYYSIHNDTTGKLLLESLIQAADRGVRVRVLVDDLNLKGADKTLLVLNGHPKIEIRVFNPFATQQDSLFTRVNEAFTDLNHFLRRMHNKAFIVDNQVAVTGGRNLGDEYFGFGEQFNFRDLDIFTAGPLSAKLSTSFDKYWNHEESFPISVLHPPTLQATELNALRSNLKQHWKSEKEAGELRQMIPLAHQLQKESVKLIWAKAELAVDEPTKVNLPEDDVKSKPIALINRFVRKAEKEFIIVSPYFVPGNDGVTWLNALEKRGVAVRVLTNSLASTDVPAVHAGYSPYRKNLLENGAELYELMSIGGRRKQSQGFSSGSPASLHTKVYIIDREDLIIGSFNMDPRSVNLNTELVVIIHSAELAGQVVKLFDRIIAPSTSYHVVLGEPSAQGRRHLRWIGEEANKQVTFDYDPKAGIVRHAKSAIFAILPFDSQL